MGMIVSLLSSLMPFWAVNIPNIFFPWPIYMVVSALAEFNWLLGLSLYILIYVLFWDKELVVFKRRSFITNILLLVLTVAWFLIARESALRHQGAFHYTICLAVNLLFNSLLWFCWKNATFSKTRLYAILLLIYLIGYAFPYLGELP